MKLDRKALENALGPEFVLQGEDWMVWLEVMFQGERIAWLNIEDGVLGSWLTIKWREKPDGWRAYEEELGREELLDAELRPLWEVRGFKVGREGISSCWYPDGSPLTPFPAVEVRVSIRVEGLQRVVDAIQFITTAKRDVWADD